MRSELKPFSSAHLEVRPVPTVLERVGQHFAAVALLHDGKQLFPVTSHQKELASEWQFVVALQCA